MVGLNGNSKRITVKIDSDNVSDVLEIRPHVHITEKEKEGYETGVKPGIVLKTILKTALLIKILYINILLYLYVYYFKY